MKTFICGEAMLEYHSHGGSGLRYGGDTLNTAIHMARGGYDVAYVTALGTDSISDALVADWEAEGLDCSHVHRHPDRTVGVYAINLDLSGERSFLYWRDRSAARAMFDLPEMASTLEAAKAAQLIYFSLITLAVIGHGARDTLLHLSRTRKASGLAVAYDSNFRPRLWEDLDTARAVSTKAAACATLGLPTDEDERALCASRDTPTLIAKRWRAEGCDEVVVKAGASGCVRLGADDAEARFFPTTPISAVDTSGAGDAFNAGYLMGMLEGDGVPESVARAQKLAARAVQYKGAVEPRRNANSIR